MWSRDGLMELNSEKELVAVTKENQRKKGSRVMSVQTPQGRAA